MFPNSWTPTTIGEISELGSGSTPSRKKHTLYFEGGNIFWVKTGDLNNGLIDSTEERITAAALKETSCKVYPIGTLLVAMYGGFKQIGRTGLLGVDAAINQALTAVAIDRVQAVPEFVQQWLNYRVDDWKRLAGSSRKDPNISKSEVSAFPILLPPKREQLAIVCLLKVWDRGILQLSDLIAAKLRFKQGLMQQLLSGKQNFGKHNWCKPEDTRFGELVEKVAEAVKVNPKATYREIGIRSHGKGIFYKEPVTGQSLGNKRVYPVVPGCLTLNIVFAWERALAVTTEQEDGMIASHRFPMFHPNRKRLLPEYALHYFLSQKGTEALQLASPGGAGRNRTLSQTEFLNTSIPLPTIVVQQKIVSFVEAVEREINILRRQLKALKQQKRGLMQKLLTGDIRVPQSRWKSRSRTGTT
jgi:type I restriction enzyme S subunit